MVLLRFTLRFLLFIPLLAACTLVARGQAQSSRFELIHEQGDQGFMAISMKQNGLALIREKPKMEDDKKHWEIILLDSTLQQTWATIVPLEPRLGLVGYDYVPGEMHFLFRQAESNYNDLVLVRVFIFTHNIQQYSITPKIDFKITHFIIVGNNAVFGGYVTRQPAVVIYEMGADRIHVAPGFFVDNTELLELKANANQTFNALLIERGKREKRRLLLKTFDMNGGLLLEDDIDVDDNHTILAATTSTLEHDELLLAGVWGTGGTANGSKQASGVFSVVVDPFNQQPVHYEDFPELEHFLDYMSHRRAVKTRNKADRRRKASKPPVFRVNVNVVRMDENEKGFLLLCEAYNPVTSANYPYYNGMQSSPYSTPYYNPYFFGSPYGYNPATMNRYYNSPYNPFGSPAAMSDVTMLHSSLILFDRQGKRKGDFALPLNELKVPQLEQVSDFYVDDRFFQFYKKQREVVLSSTPKSSEPAEQDTLKIELKSAEDVVRKESEEQGGARYWFGPYGYVWGYETIKNKGPQYMDPVRYVYYINKVRLD